MILYKNVSAGINQKLAPHTLYFAITKSGKELADSLEIPGAKRGIVHGENGIIEHANLIKHNNPKEKIDIMANTQAAVMNVASLVVGQYYMNQIASQMTAISESLEKLLEFEEIKYKSEVQTLLESVFETAQFQMAIIENEEIRNREANKIQALKNKCQNLLNQAENHLNNLLQKKITDFGDYEKGIINIEKWNNYVQILMDMFYKIDVLDFALHKGQKTKEQCFKTYDLHKNISIERKNLLIAWHNEQCEHFDIDLENNRVAHDGILSLIKKPISLINDEWNYKKLKSKTKQLILRQTENIVEQQEEFDNLFDSEVQIIIKDGKCYYLPNNTSK